MRPVKRSDVPPPEALSAADGRGARELEQARTHMGDPQTASRSFDFKAYTDDGVKFALHKLFHGKCAYCESYYFAQAPVDVEHYRPKGKVAGEADHLGYWWIAMAWDNLLPSCIDCNRRRWQELPDAPAGLEELHLAPAPTRGRAQLGKQDLFPIAGIRAAGENAALEAEAPLLLDPTRDVPAEHLAYHLDPDEPLGLILPHVGDGGVSQRGLVSIHVYGLNRLGLVQERTRILRKLEFLSRLIDALDEMADDMRARGGDGRRMAARLDVLCDRIAAEIGRMAQEDQPYCSLVRAWAERLRPQAPPEPNEEEIR